MIEACTGLVPIFGFELKDDSEGPKTSHSKDQGAPLVCMPTYRA